MRARIVVPWLTACAILAIAVSYHAYRDRRQPDDPDWLLRHADEQAWLNEWINAAPVYHRAEIFYQQRSEPAKALYAQVRPDDGYERGVQLCAADCFPER